MKSVSLAERPPAGGYWVTNLVCFLVIAYVAVRKFVYLQNSPLLPIAMALLAVYFVLSLVAILAERHIYRIGPLYILPLAMITLTLGLFPPYEDNWANLFLIMVLLALRICSMRWVLFWGIFSATSFLIIMTLTADWISALGFGLFYIACGIFIAGYEYQYARGQLARHRSEVLLAKLETANNQLKEYTAQAEELAAAQERARLARELHDSVGQVIFSISLQAESTRILLEKDLARARQELERLQELTSSTLSHMREMIRQWKPDHR